MKTKTCKECKKELPIDNFGTRKRDGVQPRCKKCQTKKTKEYYQKNKKRTKEKTKEKISWYYEYKKTLSCSLCGEDCPECLQFHHVSKDKECDVSSLACSSKKRILQEIEKCICVCSCCHRTIHAGDYL